MYQSVWKPANVDLGCYNIMEYLSLFWDLFHQLGFHAVTLGFRNTYSAPSVHLLVFVKKHFTPLKYLGTCIAFGESRHMDMTSFNPCLQTSCELTCSHLGKKALSSMLANCAGEIMSLQAMTHLKGSRRMEAYTL